MSMHKSCLCCGSSLLRHIRQGEVYWFCTSCYQEVPLLAVSQNSLDITAPVRPIQLVK